VAVEIPEATCAFVDVLMIAWQGVEYNFFYAARTKWDLELLQSVDNGQWTNVTYALTNNALHFLSCEQPQCLRRPRLKSLLHLQLLKSSHSFSAMPQNMLLSIPGIISNIGSVFLQND
jgi:hypothetical protein